MKPLCIDLFCGLGGWAQGFLAEGYSVVGFDIERHDYGTGGYPGDLVLQDVTTLDGAQFKDAAVIVASPPCQEYSYMAMPWSRAKQIAAEYRSGVRDVRKLTALFDACFRIQREASEAAGRHIPLIVENVRGAQPWVGPARWNYGSFYLWGDVPALMPITGGRKTKPGANSPILWRDREGGHFDGSYGRQISPAWRAKHYSETDKMHLARESDGVKFSHGKPRDSMFGFNGPAAFSSKSNSRKAASAQIAKIPFPLARHIARCFQEVLCFD